MINENFVYFGLFLNSLGSISYLVDTIRGRAKPNRVTYFIWGLAPLIAFFSQYKQGVGIQSLLALGVGLWPALIFIGSFFNKKAEWKITRFDVICGILSILGLVLWMVTKIGNIAIIFSIFADTLASFPTIKKSYFYPETENIWIYFSGAIYAAVVLLTVKDWSFSTYGFPVYIFFLNITITSLIKFDFKKLLKTRS